jgi:hypothetical protein
MGQGTLRSINRVAGNVGDAPSPPIAPQTPRRLTGAFWRLAATYPAGTRNPNLSDSPKESAGACPDSVRPWAVGARDIAAQGVHQDPGATYAAPAVQHRSIVFVRLVGPQCSVPPGPVLPLFEAEPQCRCAVTDQGDPGEHRNVRLHVRQSDVNLSIQIR